MRQRKLHVLEGQVLTEAAKLVATSAPLALALCTWFSLQREFSIVPNAGMPPLEHPISNPEGPLVYCGSIADWKGLDVIIQAAADTKLALRIVGGNATEWQEVCARVDARAVDWHARVSLRQIPEALAGACAGLIPTDTDVPSGEFSCPMKLFDYARCGLPVLVTALPALQSLDVGPWCTQVPSPTRGSWSEALKEFRYDFGQAEAARLWAYHHTWELRAEQLKHVFGIA
ncbi:MAG: glycosyltransferase [Verrucomicrobiota bacterium]